MAQGARDFVLNRKRKVHIIDHIDGVLEAGEMLVVLGPPGSGCTTMLKAISGERNGIYVDNSSELNYNGESLSTLGRGVSHPIRHIRQGPAESIQGGGAVHR